MAKSKHGSLTPLRNGEFIAGLLFLPCYLFFTSAALVALNRLFDWNLSETSLNLLYFVINFVAVAAIFHHFLIQSLNYAGKSFWQFLQAVILGTVFYFCVTFALTWALGKLHLLPGNQNDAAVSSLLTSKHSLMTLCVCVLVPITEECLFRGLIFGTIHKKSRVWAYIVSILVFALIHTLPYLLSADKQAAYTLKEFLIASLTYVPAGLALGWAYEKSGTIWASILTHALVNFIAAFVTVS
ncbi:MAG: CPBP family intramembrane metalloprotease, partial [Clostridia bacterium]|nr:CPBP family intramembrane metalloprotease [Clostridia bacterium]